jgi:transposase InsO family protein
VIMALSLVAKAVLSWLSRIGVRTLYIEPGSPWENGYIESFNGKLRDELLDREVFDTLLGERKCLWSDGDENTIIYDHIVHWGIDLLPRRSYSRWERRCLVPLRSTSHLRLWTNSRSGTMYGGWSVCSFFR